jgi:hypothetical protein
MKQFFNSHPFLCIMAGLIIVSVISASAGIFFGGKSQITAAQPFTTSIGDPSISKTSFKENDEGPILIPYKGAKTHEPKFYVHLFSVMPGDTKRLWDPPNMKPRKIEITSSSPLSVSDQNCSRASTVNVWFCEDKQHDIYFSDIRVPTSVSSPNSVAVTWIEY